ncbi:carbohydrate ABC transporter permease [Salipaludibacillus agaradhaerens]|uniref:Carbohydrate ABC transporter permease n=1 Tax=Salipaludibacillus agaradhaerens TaxID=76935 RepID=A0A9Q4AXR5_SALAG|nr:carbohydrate ABC transporter permease [Salipaludibacillus agaradhaerens]MCR6095032.1 carbohydrate ABC transporter permease [Salipaludibacillus agaradhaerens]MCR6115410.1 carbohydrate ABC transporter permease [Salipaludibacillus agaradhaerens]
MKTTTKWVLSILALIISLIHFVPFYILMTTAFKDRTDFSSRWLFPDYLSFANFFDAWERANLTNAFLNSMIITVGAAVLLIFFGSMAAYPLARVKSKVNQFIFGLFVAIMVIPPLAALVPLYNLVVQMGLINTHAIAILNNFASFLPLTIFLYAGFIKSTIPKELEEAARIDGAGTITLFFRIVFPLLKPITATILIISSVYIWNDYQFAIFFLQDSSVHTLTVTLSNFFGENQNNLNLVAAAALMASLPMIIVFLFLQKHFVSGLSSGAVKG